MNILPFSVEASPSCSSSDSRVSLMQLQRLEGQGIVPPGTNVGRRVHHELLSTRHLACTSRNPYPPPGNSQTDVRNRPTLLSTCRRLLPVTTLAFAATVPPLRRKQRRGGRELVSSPQSRRWVGPIRRSWRPEGAAKNKRLTTGPLAGNSLHSAVRLRRLRPRGRPAAVSPTSRATGETSPRSRSNLALR